MSSDVALPAAHSRLLHVASSLRAPLVLALAYYLGAEAAFYFGTLSDKIFALFWPPNVILFCALLLVPKRRWPVFIAAAFLAHVVAEVRIGMHATQLLMAFATNCMVALVSAVAVRRLLGGPPWFGTLRKACIYILIAAGASPAIAALGGAFVPILGGGSSSDYWLFWSHWYVGNALAALTFGPAFLTWVSDSPASSAFASGRRKAEALVVGAALILACMVAFEVTARTLASGFLPALLYTPLPLILWAAIRFGEKGASGAILLITIVLTWRTVNGPSLFIGGDPERNVLALQLFLIGLAIPVLLLGAAIDELRRAEQTTRELAGSILRARDEEGRRIARELHDSTGQNLVVASLMAGRLDRMVPSSAKPTLGELDKALQQSIRELRTVSYLLHPPLLDEAGLALALRHYVDGFVQRSGIKVDLEVSSDMDRLPRNVELALFRVVQEGLTNVSRHSASSTARIRLARRFAPSGQQVVLVIEDAGIGMAETIRVPGSRGKAGGGYARGVGLAGMRERLHQVGGSLEIDTAPGRTVLTAIAPASDEAMESNA
jgi:signal transduction histidine kinase